MQGSGQIQGSSWTAQWSTGYTRMHTRSPPPGGL